MASIQEQLKHIRSANDEWYDEHRRLVPPVALLNPPLAFWGMYTNQCYAGLSENWPNSLVELHRIPPAHHRPRTPRPQHRPPSLKIAAVDLKKSPRLGSDMCLAGLGSLSTCRPFLCLGLLHDISFVGSCFTRFVSCRCFVSLYVIGPRIPSLLLLFVVVPGLSGMFMFNTFILFNAFWGPPSINPGVGVQVWVFFS
jgi:hypothetical protein